MRISDWSSDVCSSDLVDRIIAPYPMAGSGNGTWWNYALIQIREGSARMTQGLTMERPAHVPEELVRDYPIRMGTIKPENPFDRMSPEIHAEMPAIFYRQEEHLVGKEC